jgi:hypothetical protein
MAKENMQMGEGFAAEVKRADASDSSPVAPQASTTGQRVTGWIILGGGATGIGAAICHFLF